MLDRRLTAAMKGRDQRWASSPVTTQATPGIANALAASIARILA